METFFASHQYTFSAIGAIGSMLAVIVSLLYSYAAHSQNTKVRVKCTLNPVYVPTMGPGYMLDMINNSFFDVNIDIAGIGIRYGRGDNFVNVFSSYFFVGVITLKRGESKTIILNLHEDFLAFQDINADIYANIIKCNDKLAKRKFFGKFGNKFYTGLTDGTKIKIYNRIPKNVPNK